MQGEIFKYLEGQRVGVLAVARPDGSTHAATVHFAYTQEPFTVLMGTGSNTVKGEVVLEAGPCKASFVVGFSEEEMRTCQFDGEVRVVAEEHVADFDATYLGRLPEKAERALAPTFLRLVFVPNWWRFSDMKERVVLESE